MGLLAEWIDVILPRTCGACNRILAPWEDSVCLLCLMEMPLSNYHQDPDNPVARVFWGRVQLEQAGTWFIYKNGSRYGNLLHRLKYEGQPTIGIAMGKQYGYQLLHSAEWKNPELIIPVPLHPKRKRKRGYNQSEMIAKGLSSALAIPVVTNCLIRSKHTHTQTAKSRADRYSNVEGKFEIKHAHTIENKHVLLVDDVITTGATMEACAATLLQTDGVTVSALGIAFAEKRS